MEILRAKNVRTAVILTACFMLFAACAPSDRGGQEGLRLSATEATMAVGERLELAATAGQTVTWQSGDPAVATVTDGVVYAVASGETVVTATAGEEKAACRITVIPVRGTLIWSDEFEGDALDESKWGYQLGVRDEYGESRGPQFWGNNELQYYTKEAVAVEEGALRITATREEMPEGRSYSSARILTRGKFSFTYGYAEAKLKLPLGTGMWPAFWALPEPATAQSTQNEYGGWAANGEIDIMEARGRVPDSVDTTLHFGRGGRSTYDSKAAHVDTISAWHTYGLEWRADSIAWYIDGREVHRILSADWWTEAVSKEENASAPFDKPFHLLLNLAVGGNYDGGREPPETFVSAEMLADYVRVYRLDP